MIVALTDVHSNLFEVARTAFSRNVSLGQVLRSKAHRASPLTMDKSSASVFKKNKIEEKQN